ncbi:hypothetical protein PAGU2595_028360 [Lysobacter xanthus]
MKTVAVVLVALALASCSRKGEQSIEPRQVVVPDYAIDAFGGRLLGTNQGEWVGRLYFQDPAGSLHVLLKENVHGIARNSAGTFVFTGLAHLGINEGYVYRVVPSSGDIPAVALVGRLPGEPSQVTPQPAGATSFLVFSGRQAASGRWVYDCYELNGSVVSPSTRCQPPKPGANNSSKPTPLRGAA